MTSGVADTDTSAEPDPVMEFRRLADGTEGPPVTGSHRSPSPDLPAPVMEPKESAEGRPAWPVMESQLAPEGELPEPIMEPRRSPRIPHRVIGRRQPPCSFED
jgi:hypothetical protein